MTAAASTEAGEKSFTEMSGPELVVAFNEMANSKVGQELGAKPVQRFADTKVALKRVEMLASSIKARAAGLKRHESEEPSAPQPERQESEESTMSAAKKKASAKTAKTAKAKAAPAPKLTGAAGIVQSFGPRAGSFREKLLVKLVDNLGSQVRLNDLITSTYGREAAKEDMKGALGMVLKGVNIMILAGKLPYCLEKEKDDKGHISYGLYKK